MAERMLLEFAQAVVRFSVLRAHFLEVDSKAKDIENCHYTMQPNWKQLKLIFRIRFCTSAWSLRSNRWDVWRVWNPSWKNGETRCDGVIKFLTRAKCEQDGSTFGLMTRPTKIFYCSNMENEWKVFTIRQIESNLYGRMISECCWNWTVLPWRNTLQNFHNFMQWYTLPRHEEASQPKGTIQGDTKLDASWKLPLVVCTA